MTQIKAQIEDTTSDYDKEKLQERLAKLAGGVAVIKVGAATEVELKEKKHRIEDALSTTRAAVEEGLVAGGGTTLLQAIPALDKLKLEGDEQVGVDIVRKALEAPARQIADNAGASGEVVVSKVRGLKTGEGYDALQWRVRRHVREGHRRRRQGHPLGAPERRVHRRDGPHDGDARDRHPGEGQGRRRRRPRPRRRHGLLVRPRPLATPRAPEAPPPGLFDLGGPAGEALRPRVHDTGASWARTRPRTRPRLRLLGDPGRVLRERDRVVGRQAGRRAVEDHHATAAAVLTRHPDRQVGDRGPPQVRDREAPAKAVTLLVGPGNAGARLRPAADAVDRQAVRPAVEHDHRAAAVAGEGGKVGRPVVIEVAQREREAERPVLVGRAGHARHILVPELAAGGRQAVDRPSQDRDRPRAPERLALRASARTAGPGSSV